VKEKKWESFGMWLEYSLFGHGNFIFKIQFNIRNVELAMVYILYYGIAVC
jgi:hypothetical protein